MLHNSDICLSAAMGPTVHKGRSQKLTSNFVKIFSFGLVALQVGTDNRIFTQKARCHTGWLKFRMDADSAVTLADNKICSGRVDSGFS